MDLCVCVFVRCIVHHQIRKECVCVAYYCATSDAGVRFKSACVCCVEIVGMKRRDGVRYKESRGDVPEGWRGWGLSLMERGDKDGADGCAVILVASARKLGV